MSSPLESLQNYEKFEYKVDQIPISLNYTLFTRQTMHYGAHLWQYGLRFLQMTCDHKIYLKFILLVKNN
jgi:hypothetical protein